MMQPTLPILGVATYPLPSDIRHKRNNRHIFDNKNNFVADVADVAAGLATESDGDPFACLKDPD